MEPGDWSFYWYLTLTSGVALTGLYVWSSAIWLLEIKGLAVLIKCLLLALGALFPDARGVLFVTIIVLSGFVAHAPARLRSMRWVGIAPSGPS